MRFNEKRTCLEFFQTGLPSNFFVAQRDWPEERKEWFRNNMKEVFAFHQENFQKKVQFITDPFAAAVWENKDKVAEALKADPLGNVSGTFIVNMKDGITKTMFYDIENPAPKDFQCTYIEFTKSKNDDIIACGAAIHISNDGTAYSYIGDGYLQYGLTKAAEILADFIIIVGFLKYCDIETKILKPKEKHREFNVRYFNETKSNIEILDSRWFMDIIRTEGFKVRGHFRLQPYGPGLSKRRWQYIKPFEKTGYTLSNKKNNQDNG